MTNEVLLLNSNVLHTKTVRERKVVGGLIKDVVSRVTSEQPRYVHRKVLKSGAWRLGVDAFFGMESP